jgi:hypothetical protein
MNYFERNEQPVAFCSACSGRDRPDAQKCCANGPDNSSAGERKSESAQADDERLRLVDHREAGPIASAARRGEGEYPSWIFDRGATQPASRQQSAVSAPISCLRDGF